MALPAVLLTLATLLLAGCSQQVPSMFRAESTGAADIRTLAFIVFAILSGVLLTVWVWLLIAIVRYRNRPESAASQTRGNLRVEAVWTLIPAIIVGVLFYLTVHTTGVLTAAVPQGVDLKVTGHQWWWAVDYPSGKFATANEIHVPVDRNITAQLISVDVIHSFWVPQMGGKLDMIPGRLNTIHFLPTSTGTYIGACSEYCGHQHGRMRFLLMVDTVDEYAAWFANQRRTARAPVRRAGHGRLHGDQQAALRRVPHHPRQRRDARRGRARPHARRQPHDAGRRDHHEHAGATCVAG